MTTLRGLFSNLPTAFTDDGAALRVDVMQNHIEWLLYCGVHGISSQLSSGEFAYLSFDERCRLTHAVAKAVGDRVPVLIGVSGNSTAETVVLAQHAEAAGATVAMVMPRSYYRLTEDEVLRLFESVSRTVSIPLGIYNNPFSTGVDISAALYQRITQLGNILVTKDGCGDLFRLPQVKAACPQLAYLVGTEYLLLPALRLGADGACLAITSVLPEQMLAIYSRAVDDKDPANAREAYERMLPVLTFFRNEGVCRSAKAVATLIGKSFGPHRAPLQPLPSDKVAHLSEILLKVGIPITPRA